MNVAEKSKWRHFLAGDVCRECKKCTKKTWHSFVERKKVIQVVNRSGKRKRGRHRLVCVLRRPAFYVNQYSVYQCQDCGRKINLPGWPKRISKKKAKQSRIEMMPNLSFWMSMYQ
jgi:hypothetical protein